MRGHPKVSQSCQRHSSLLSCVTRQRKCFCNSCHGVVEGPQPGTGSQKDRMNSWEKFLPAITAMPGSGHREKHWQRLVGAESFISSGLELSWSIRVMMNPSPVPRKREIFTVSPSHPGLLDGPRTGPAGTVPLLQPLPCESLCILSSSRDHMHY